MGCCSSAPLGAVALPLHYRSTKFIKDEKFDQTLEAAMVTGKLTMENINLGPEGAKALAGALSSMPNLTELALGNNEIGPEGFKALAGALSSMPNLTTLAVRDNAIGPEGFKVLAVEVAVAMSGAWQWSNDFGPEGAKALVGALSSMPNLTSLNLGSCDLGPEGAKVLAVA
eukprot:CAMPEP_0180211274 /NCGR_PEP_ID=MMETSP0987-20121128/12709_1 /TAXON_ID=697907 /ORGANISM="non described non described, Strain CCMP2293" /LENGTH=170 /DNA_ID=CAMNT_0022168523 /DNA_START=170 /DNA_END=678 /DNA_ORIENTATION=-